MYTKLSRTVVLTFVMSLLAGICAAQPRLAQKPRKEKLLNDLSLLIWRQPAADKIKVNLRIHSGSAFDPLGKEGTAKLLTEVMFPNTGIFEDFEEDLGGSLLVSSNHDFLQIEMTAKPDKLVEILQILAGALTLPQIDKDTTAEAKKARLEKLSETAEDPASIADAQTAERLYGVFPYGRSTDGTVESIPDIDFADLIFAKQRFLNADNATLSISGNLDAGFVYRAARRLLGGWKKGNGHVPSNFTLPEAPDVAPLVVNTESGVSVEQRFAVDSVSRRDADHFAAKILSRVLDARLKNRNGGNVRYHYFYLRGYLVLSQTLPRADAPPPLADPGISDSSSKNPLADLLSRPVESAEFESAKSLEIAAFRSTDTFRLWFDIDTYDLKSVDDEFKKIENVTLGDLNNVAKKLGARPIVDVSVMPLDATNPADDGDPDDPL